MPSKTKIWTYKGVNVYPAGLNASGIRWWALNGQLRADTKESMRQLINKELRKERSS